MTRYYVGIDCGVNTGFAIWDKPNKKLILVETTKIHRAMDYVKDANANEIKVRIEDARQVVFNTDPVKAQGAGSVKRDAKIWEDFLKDIGVDHEFVRPNKRMTKLSQETFQKITGYKAQTSQHARDAAMLVFGL